MPRPPRPIGQYYGDDAPPQTPADVAVVIPTLLRPDLAQALGSIYAQDFHGRIQVVIGVDIRQHEPAATEAALEARPPNVSAVFLHLPFSTSVRHGGVHLALDGGALRSILSLIANSRYVTYLDDDNLMLPQHLRRLHEAVQGKAWSYTQRMLVDEATDVDLAIDRWDSVGPGRGRMAAEGGFVDTNCLMVDKVKVGKVLGRWCEPLFPQQRPGYTADRHFFQAIAKAPYGRVDEATVRYKVRPTNIMLKLMKAGVEYD
jgi:hypothetical protein